jgi:hypothetical protein
MYAQEDFSIKSKSFSVETFGGDINLLSSANIDNKCILNHTINATKDIQHKCTENMTVDVGMKTHIKSEQEYVLDANDILDLKSAKAFTINSSDKININASSDIEVVGSAAVSLKSGSAFGIKSGANINVDGTAIHIQEGLAASPSATTVAKVDALLETDPLTMRTQIVDAQGNITNKFLPSTQPEIFIRDYTDKGVYTFSTPTEVVELPVDAHSLVRQTVTGLDLSTLPPISTRFDGAARRYESPEDMDSKYNIYMTDLKIKAGYDPTQIIPTPLATYLP